MPNPIQEPSPALDPEPGIRSLRARLGDYIAYVQTHDIQVRVTAYGRPAGTLVSPERAHREGYTIHGTWTVDEAVKRFPVVREQSASKGPQLIQGRSGMSAVMLAPSPQSTAAPVPEAMLDLEPTIRALRPKLGDYVTRVHTHDVQVRLNIEGGLAGVLVSRTRLEQGGLSPRGTWSVDRARVELATVRERATSEGPQLIQGRTGASAVLISPEHARVLLSGPESK